MAASNESSSDDRELVTTRLFDAPRELVFDTWTDIEHIGHWWGPRGFTTTTHSIDLRPGGVWRFTMHGPDGTDYPNRVIYEEIARPERLVYRHDAGEDGDPRQFQTTVTFEEQGAQTMLTLRTRFATAEVKRQVVEEVGAIEGAKQTLDRFGEYLAGRKGTAA
jgi:uncharacterized protein YndB with AHSA1/START domain